MNMLDDMRYNEDFIRANRIVTWECEVQGLKARKNKPYQYPDPTDRIKYLEGLIAKERSLLNANT